METRDPQNSPPADTGRTAGDWLLYGAYGYTGRLILREALRRGHRPVLAGRDESKLRPLAKTYELPFKAFTLSSPQKIASVLQEVALVFNAAGPFSATAKPMLMACLETGTHYLDVTGELESIQGALATHEQALKLGISVLPAVGFDIIPSDCLASYVARQVPQAVNLEIGISALDAPSPGTTKTMLEMMVAGGKVRRDGVLVSYPLGAGGRSITFSHGRSLHCIPVPWGDLASAEKSTGIRNVTTYLAFPRWPGMRYTNALNGKLLSITPLRRLAQKAAGLLMHGPDEHQRLTGRSFLWAQATDPHGNKAQAWLETAESYQFTAEAAVLCLEKVLVGNVDSGALTPSQAFGVDFPLQIEGTKRIDQYP